MNIAYLLTGSNQGDREGNLSKAISYLNKSAGKVTNCSPVYKSPPWGFEHPSPFLNQALEIQTTLPPADLLDHILSIETHCGRVRNNMEEYEARTLDIDILLYDDLVIDTKKLSIPHPRLHLRRFALMPLSDIAGGLVHPQLSKSINELLAACSDKSEVVEFSACSCAGCKCSEGRA